MRWFWVIALLALLSGNSLAQTYPSKPVHLVVPFPASGPTDIIARAIGQKLSEAIGQPVVVDNKPGAGGAIGSEAVAHSAPDGYTILLATSSTHSIGPALNPKTPYNVERDFAPVSLVATAPNVLVVSPRIPVNNVRELIALPKRSRANSITPPAASAPSSTCRQSCSAAWPGSRLCTFPTKG